MITVSLETAVWEARARQLSAGLAQRKRAVLERGARAFVFRVIPLTPAQSPERIEAELRATYRGGAGTVARAALAVQLRRKGRNPRDLAAGAFGAAVEELIRRRVAGAGLLRAGWLAAGRPLGIGAFPGVILRTPSLGGADVDRADVDVFNTVARRYLDSTTIAAAARAVRVALRAAGAGLKSDALEQVTAAALAAGLAK